MKLLTIKLFILALLLSSCIDFTTEYKIDPVLEKYVNKFFAEGEKRGDTIPKENLIVKIFDNLDDEEGVWGKSKRSGFQRIVLIDREYVEFNEQNGNPVRNEAVIFHELGHALLGRKHTDKYESIMNINSCYSTHCYTGQKEILDELFSTWYTVNQYN